MRRKLQRALRAALATRTLVTERKNRSVLCKTISFAIICDLIF